MPAVLVTYYKEYENSEETMIQAMYVAAGIGQVIASRASLAGASGGCQAEIGSASGMAAAAICSVRGGSKEQMGHACAMALKNLMGLVCDPVAGLVEASVCEKKCRRCGQRFGGSRHGTGRNHQPDPGRSGH